ncbi:MAG: hypothetical protein AAB439_02890 [Patescibacteria group bacterium]
MSPKKVTQSKKHSLNARRTRRRTFLVGSVVVVGVLLSVGVFVGLRREEVTLASVSVSETTYVRGDLIIEIVEESLRGSFAFIVPRANAFFYPHDAIQKELQTTFHSIKEVTFKREGLTALAVSIVERTPEARWCDDSTPGTRCLFLDETGFAFALATSSESMRTYTGGGFAGTLGTTFLPEEYQRLKVFLDDLTTASGRTITEVAIDEYGDVFVRFKEGGEVRVTLSSINTPLLDTIASVFRSRRFSEGDEFLYADFRFGNKIYVKFVGE